MVGAHYFNKKRSGYMIQAQDVQTEHHNLEGQQITYDLLLQCRRLVQKALPIPLKTSAEFKFRTSQNRKWEDKKQFKIILMNRTGMTLSINHWQKDNCKD